MAKPEVTVATINWNGGSYAKTFFESVKLQDFPKGKMEVIMIDNGSTDGSLEFVKENFPFVKIIEKEKNYGFATACNIAFAAASPTGTILSLPPFPMHFTKPASRLMSFI